LLMGGIVGRLFREFAIVLSIAVGWSLLVSLCVTPMLCSVLLQPHSARRHGSLYRLGERILQALEDAYASGVRTVLRYQPVVLVVALATCALTVYLYIVIPKGFFPLQDTGRIIAQIRARQDISFDEIEAKAQLVQDIVMTDPVVTHESSFFGLNPVTPSPNIASLYVILKGYDERGGLPSIEVIKRLEERLADLAGVEIAFRQQQELNIGARNSAAQFQYSLTSSQLELLDEWAPRLVARMAHIGALRDITSDQVNSGLTLQLDIDRATASRYGVSAQEIDESLYDAFGQRQVSTLYGLNNQYHVVLEAAPQYQLEAGALSSIYVHGARNALIPLSNFTHVRTIHAPLVVNHQGQFPCVTISFNLAPGYSLGEASLAIDEAARQIGMPEAVHTNFAGVAQEFQESLKSQPLLILLAVVTIYLVLGMLYESLVQPLTILATLPSAGVGALLALMLSGNEFNVIAMIGVVLLIGIVQKNSIILIDFALHAERAQGKSPEAAIFEACRLRFRPIIMTSMTALLGALPLALGGGVGFELRRPLGISIAGGLCFSLILTLFSTPVLYLYFGRLNRWLNPPAASA